MMRGLPSFFPQSITLAEVAGHASFCLVALSYSIDDMLWLRCTAVAGSACCLVFSYFHPFGKVLWLPFRWHALFIVINLLEIVKLGSERYLAEKLTPEENSVRDRHLPNFSAVDYARLLSVSERRVIAPGGQLFPQAALNSTVYLVVSGEFESLVDDVRTYTLTGGNFVAEGAIHAGALIRAPVRTSAAVRALPCGGVVLAFDRVRLVDLLEDNASVRSSLQASLCWDIVQKLKRQRKAAALEEGGEGLRRRTTAEQTLGRLKNEQTLGRYAAVVGAIVGERQTVSKEERKVIDKYRAIHVVDDERHKNVLGKHGWTIEEFELGRKNAFEEERQQSLIDLTCRDCQ